MIIYKITNNINKKVYIGLTTQTLEYRWKDISLKVEISIIINTYTNQCVNME